MKIDVVFTDPVQQQIARKTASFDLPDQAVYGDLLDAFARQFGADLDSRIWDADARRFKAGITVVGQDRYLVSLRTRLLEGEKITVFPSVAGG